MKRLSIALGLLATLALGLPSSASADFGFSQLGVEFLNSDGSAATQAGLHPFAMTTTLNMNTVVEPEVGEVPDGEARNLEVDLPPGFAGDPTAVPQCTEVEFVTRVEGRSGCPDASAVGLVALKIEFGPLPANNLFLHVPVFNLVPPPGAAAKLGFVALNVPLSIDLGVRGEYPNQVFASLENIPQAVFFYGSKLTVWGNPADERHDALRGSCLSKEALEVSEEPVSRGECPVGIPEEAFITMPRSCTGPLSTGFAATAWNTGVHATGSAATPPGMTGCDKLRFAPQIAARPTTQEAASASGLDFGLEVPNQGLLDPKGTAGSDIEKAVVTLPRGVTLNPSQAEGLGVCSESDLSRETLGSEPGQGCPESSKIGSVEVESPLLKGEILKGSLFVATPFANRFHTLIALYMVFRDRERGIVIKQAGKVEPDPSTGQLVTTFDQLPQLPFSHFRLHFREGGRSPLVTPPSCGDYTTEAVFTPWANPSTPYKTTSTFHVTRGVGGGPCPPAGPPPFVPGFEAGTIANQAGSFSPFLMRLTRRDGDQDLTRFSSALPSGLVAKLAGVGECSDAAIAVARAKSGLAELASPSCPASSKIGRVLAGAGVGDELTYVPGSLYLAGPYHGAPLSVAAIVPAVAGPFDVGTVVTRVALRVDPATAKVMVDGAASDPIPHILAGIPLAVRDIQVYVDRPNFTLNPTGCDPAAVGATLWGGGSDVFSPVDDVPVPRSDRFQAAGCAALGFKPQLGLRLSGGTRRGAHPALRGVFKPRGGDANAAAAVIALPRSAFLDQGHIRTVCTRVQFAAGGGEGAGCPAGSVYGHAVATTPLLDAPLQGPVFLRSSNHKLPDLVAALHGQIDVELSGRIDSVHGGIRSSFESVPDAPVTKFVLSMQGGRKGLLVNSRNICRGANRAKARFVAQNGRVASLGPRLRNPACPKGGAARGKSGHGHRG